jgi:predicted NBD/HSP70 family sugar kinase
MTEVFKPRVTVRDLRRVNRAALLRPLFLDGPLNRAQLGEVTGLTGASITNLVAELLEEGLIAEAGTEESDGGRPRGLLRVNPSYGSIVGVTVREQEVCMEVFDLSLQSLARRVLVVNVEEEPVASVIRQVVIGVQELIDRVQTPGQAIAIGIAVPGGVEHSPDYVVHAPKIGWESVPLAKLVEEGVALPVLVENDAKALGQAEMWFGAGRGAREVMVADIGDGVGAALFHGGTPYNGFASSAGEWGHMCIVAEGRRCRCGARGCLEAYVGAWAIMERWAENDRRLRRVRPQQWQSCIERLVATAAGSPGSRQLLQETATYLGIGAANVVNFLNPERIVLGGWAGLLLGPAVLPRVREVVAEQALAYPAQHVSIEVGKLGSASHGLPAATLVMSEVLANGGQLGASGARPSRASRDQALVQRGVANASWTRRANSVGGPVAGSRKRGAPVE